MKIRAIAIVMLLSSVILYGAKKEKYLNERTHSRDTRIIKNSFLHAFLDQTIQAKAGERAFTFPDYRPHETMLYSRSWQWGARYFQKKFKVIINDEHSHPTLQVDKKIMQFFALSDEDKVRFLEYDNIHMRYMMSRIRLYVFLRDAVSYLGMNGCKQLPLLAHDSAVQIDDKRLKEEQEIIKKPYPLLFAQMVPSHSNNMETDFIQKFIQLKHRIAVNRLQWFDTFVQGKSPVSSLKDSHSFQLYVRNIYRDQDVLDYWSHDKMQGYLMDQALWQKKYELYTLVLIQALP